MVIIAYLLNFFWDYNIVASFPYPFSPSTPSPVLFLELVVLFSLNAPAGVVVACVPV